MAIGGQTGTVTRFQPLRILLAGRDRRYIRVTSFLLEQRGYVVRAAKPDDAADAAKRHRADVVLLEGDRMRTDAARCAAAIVALNPTAHVILMVDATSNGPTGLTMLRKWAELDELVDEIERAALRSDASAIVPVEDGAA
jgi:CheY-like chemotaxis protein